MENNKDYLCSYKFYDEEGRRLSIFAEKLPGEFGGEFLGIKILPCSKKDDFSKKWAREAFEILKNGGKPMMLTPGKDKEVKFLSTTADLVDGKPKASFLKFCNQNFFKLVDLEIQLPSNVQEIVSMKAFNPRLVKGPKNHIHAKILIKNDKRTA